MALIWGIWTLVACFFTSQIYFASLSTQHPYLFSEAVLSQFTSCYLLALSTPLVLWLARRFPLERQYWPRTVALHLSLSAALSILISSCDYLLFTWYFKGAYYIAVSVAFRVVLYNLDRPMEIYWLILLMSQGYNLYHRYQREELRASQLQSLLAQTQLQALKMQLHPHFLFNTLHSISSLLNKDTEAARKMITRLGDFLRLTLENSGMQEVTLQQEIEFLNGYLEIERVRFQDRLTTHLEVEPQTLDAQVPNLILQPLVENAIRHGIAPRSTPGHIEISAMQVGDVLRLSVKDNGPGLSENHVPSNRYKPGLGILNTRARLEHLYGNAQRLDIANDPGGGLIVTIEIPATSLPTLPSAINN